MGEEYFRNLDSDSFGAHDVEWGVKSIVSRIERYARKPSTDKEFRQKTMNFFDEKDDPGDQT